MWGLGQTSVDSVKLIILCDWLECDWTFWILDCSHIGMWSWETLMYRFRNTSKIINVFWNNHCFKVPHWFSLSHLTASCFAAKCQSSSNGHETKIDLFCLSLGIGGYRKAMQPCRTPNVTCFSLHWFEENHSPSSRSIDYEWYVLVNIWLRMYLFKVPGKLPLDLPQLSQWILMFQLYKMASCMTTRLCIIVAWVHTLPPVQWCGQFTIPHCGVMAVPKVATQWSFGETLMRNLCAQTVQKIKNTDCAEACPTWCTYMFGTIYTYDTSWVSEMLMANLSQVNGSWILLTWCFTMIFSNQCEQRPFWSKPSHYGLQASWLSSRACHRWGQALHASAQRQPLGGQAGDSEGRVKWTCHVLRVWGQWYQLQNPGFMSFWQHMFISPHSIQISEIHGVRAYRSSGNSLSFILY